VKIKKIFLTLLLLVVSLFNFTAFPMKNSVKKHLFKTVVGKSANQSSLAHLNRQQNLVTTSSQKDSAQKRNFRTSSPQSWLFKNWWHSNEASSEETVKTYRQIHDTIHQFVGKNYSPSQEEDAFIDQLISTINSKDINKKIFLNDTVLTDCIRNTIRCSDDYSKKIIKKLLEKGADPLFKPNFDPCCNTGFADTENPFWRAALIGNVGAFEAMIDYVGNESLSIIHNGQSISLGNVLATAINRCNVLHEKLQSDWQRVKDEGCNYHYKYRHKGSSYGSPYDEDEIKSQIECVIAQKATFEKLEAILKKHVTINYNKSEIITDKLVLSGYNEEIIPHNETLIDQFIDEKVALFHRFKHATIYHKHEFAIKDRPMPWEQPGYDWWSDDIFSNDYAKNHRNNSHEHQERKPRESIFPKGPLSVDQMYQLVHGESNFYPQEIFGIEYSASPEEIKNAFHKQAKLFHPDLYQDVEKKQKAEYIMKVLNKACYELMHRNNA